MNIALSFLDKPTTIVKFKPNDQKSQQLAALHDCLWYEWNNNPTLVTQLESLLKEWKFDQFNDLIKSYNLSNEEKILILVDVMDSSPQLIIPIKEYFKIR